MTDAESVKLIGTAGELNAITRKLKRAITGSGVRRLQSIRESISKDAKFPMPPIRIVPWGLVTPNSAGLVLGYVSYADLRNVQKIGAFIPAGALVAIESEKLLRRVLVHEFAHCFWFEVQILRATFDGVPKADYSSALSNEELHEIQMVEDNTQLVDPTGWFSKSDAEQLLTSYENPEFEPAHQRFRSEWVDVGLPVRVHDLSPHVSRKGEISDEVVERARALGLVKNLPSSSEISKGWIA